MRIPEIRLDDRSFQDLVNEGRTRIAQNCPEWTEHNVSDPGITLLELFAFLTESLLYRVNRIPDKMHVTLLDLLGIRLGEPSAARAEIRFTLSAPPEAPIAIPAVTTEVATARTPSEEPVVFTTTEDFTIPIASPVAYAVERGGSSRELAVAAGVARPKGADQLAFGNPPAIGDAVYLGFDTSLARLTMRLDVDCSQARGAGVDPEDPPLRWEVSTHGGWVEATVIEDLTGGFNYGAGRVVLDLPRQHDAGTVGGKHAFWLRCRLDARSRSGATSATYSHAPEIYMITGAPIGATIAAAHATPVLGEDLGLSDGTPGQEVPLRYAPVLELEQGETVEVLDPTTGVWTQWDHRETFAESGPEDRHFVLDLASGTVEFGPAVRTPEGAWRQYGAVPPKGSGLRLTRYRHGGGRRGNVSAGALTVLKTAIPTVASVVNPAAATGGVDPEDLASARQRAALELRTRYRAVTAEDYEFLCGEASPVVARAICLAPADGSGVRVHIVPRIDAPERLLPFDELQPSEALLEEVALYLDERRVIGTHVDLRPPRYRGVSVVVNVQAAGGSDPGGVEAAVSRALYTYLNPLVGGVIGGSGDGWQFGRSLNVGELYGVVQTQPGVDHVKILRVYETNLATGQQEPKPAGSHVVLEPDELIASGEHMVKAERPGA